MVLWRVWREYRWYYSWPAIWFKRIALWCAIVGRENQADYRTGPLLAWDIAYHLWDERDHYSRNPHNRS